MLITVLYIAAALVATVVLVLVIVIAMQPPEFRVTRSIAIAAPAGEAFEQVNDFHHWNAWSPWAKIDPAMKQTYEGAPAGAGAIYTWVGNKQVGEGRMTILTSRPNEVIAIKLEFFKPFKATNTAEFTFKNEREQTLVTWSMLGKLTFMSKAFHLICNMDKIVGGQFDQGLANMKSVVEAKQGVSS
jgi:hypothetical protein